jgi:C1A family cysteine protease
MNHIQIKILLVPLLAAALVACPIKDPPNITDKIRGIEASATPASIASGATSSLVATVSGIGTFNTSVNWSIASGGGSLSSNTGGSVTYTAPTVTSAITVQIKAAAAGDSSISKSLQISVQVGTPGADPLVGANAWKDPIPADAEQVSPEEFRTRFASGELTILSSASIETQQQSREQSYQQDKTFLQGIPNKDPNTVALLSEAAASPNYEGDHAVAGPDGKPVMVFGLGTQLRNAADSYTRSQSVDNALSSYRLIYELLPDALKTQAATPDSLQGKSLEEVQTALQQLNDLLATIPASLGTARLEVGSTVRPQAFNSGNGTDNNGVCNPVNLVQRYWFPLKNFVGPVKSQGGRNTCWAFAATATLESRERVQNNTNPDLSEQFLINKVKQAWASSDYWEGGSADYALDTALSKGQVFPSEPFWTYNPALGRSSGKDGEESSYTFSCIRGVPRPGGGFDPYSGTCSDTAHQSKRVCTGVVQDNGAVLKVCSSVAVTYGGAGVVSGKTTQLWKNGDPFNLFNYRWLLSQGHVLMASFPVYKGFMDDVKNDAEVGKRGVVSNYARTMLDKDGKEVDGAYGGHVVQLVGFLSNDDLISVGITPNIGGGGYFILKNSWGCFAGDGGYYYIPADYVSSIFDTLSVLNFDGRRSDAWNKEQAIPGGSDPTKIVIKANPARVDLRVETDLAKFFQVLHPVAKSVNLSVTSDKDGSLYNGAWSTDTTALFGSSLKRVFATQGSRTLSLLAKYGSGQVQATLNVNVVNTTPTLELQYTGDARQNEAFPIAALITDINEADLGKMCANTTWAVDAPDKLLSATGCLQKVTFGTTGSREVRVSTVDNEGAMVSKTLSLNVLAPPENPYPIITSTSLNSREYKLSGDFNFCVVKGVSIGTTINLTQKGCVFSAGDPLPNRYFVGAAIDNPTNEVLTYDWSLYVTGSKEYILYTELGSSKNSFELGGYGNNILTTTSCRVTLKVNAPDPARSKTLTVWTGNCSYYALGGN